MDFNERLSAREKSILFSNLSKGCEKQYRVEEAKLFSRLAEYFSEITEEGDCRELSEAESILKEELEMFKGAKEIASTNSDRGALRALTWGEKVSRMVGSIMNRYLKKGSELLEGTNIHVCEICGFVYLGDEPPDVCPVCKVPKFKISKVRR